MKKFHTIFLSLLALLLNLTLPSQENTLALAPVRPILVIHDEFVTPSRFIAPGSTAQVASFNFFNQDTQNNIDLEAFDVHVTDSQQDVNQIRINYFDASGYPRTLTRKAQSQGLGKAAHFDGLGIRLSPLQTKAVDVQVILKSTLQGGGSTQTLEFEIPTISVQAKNQAMALTPAQIWNSQEAANSFHVNINAKPAPVQVSLNAESPFGPHNLGFSDKVFKFNVTALEDGKIDSLEFTFTSQADFSDRTGYATLEENGTGYVSGASFIRTTPSLAKVKMPANYYMSAGETKIFVLILDITDFFDEDFNEDDTFLVGIDYGTPSRPGGFQWEDFGSGHRSTWIDGQGQSRLTGNLLIY